ncbi:hypothetical protein SO802_002941 [Lithocarpus litseifolius]|uniref:Uncharacterized protein n=1 Tax=Lithocarpus litseifolius TaxID=425828 RepID=A0AAW2E1A3_9ROSI
MSCTTTMEVEEKGIQIQQQWMREQQQQPRGKIFKGRGARCSGAFSVENWRWRNIFIPQGKERTLKSKLIEMDWIGLEFKHILCLLGVGLGEHFHFQFHGM